MTAAVIWHPRLAEGCDRINALTAEANIKQEQSEMLASAKMILLAPASFAEADVLAAWKFYADSADDWADMARKIIDKPTGFTDAVLREVCCIYMNLDGTGVHYLRAQQHIEAINRREFMARNCPQPETPADVFMSFRDKWDQVIVWGFVVAVAVWAGLGGLR